MSETKGKKTVKKESRKAKTERILRIAALLEKEYGDSRRCFLDYETDWQLLFAVILSAQCTDARVNMVTKELYQKYTKLEDFAGAELSTLENDIRSTGFYHNKAKNIIACAGQLLRDHGGKVPETMEELTALAGVGRKTANVVRGQLFGLAGIAVDTHVKRVSRKLGITDTDDPEKAEYELMELLPEEIWITWNHDIISIGRTTCVARRERCEECLLRVECPSAAVQQAVAKSPELA